MFGAIKPLGTLLATLPVAEDGQARTAGANFQLAYRSNFLLPHRQVAWVRFAERLEEAALFASRIDAPAQVAGVLDQVAVALESTRMRLAAHIEQPSVNV